MKNEIIASQVFTGNTDNNENATQLYVNIEKETEKAYLLTVGSFKSSDINRCWFPKSQVNFLGNGLCIIPSWLIAKNVTLFVY